MAPHNPMTTCGLIRSGATTPILASNPLGYRAIDALSDPPPNSKDRNSNGELSDSVITERARCRRPRGRSTRPLDWMALLENRHDR